MSDYIEVSLVILGESRDDDIYKQIVEEINKVNGKIVAISHTTGTNVIDVSAHWDEPEIGRKIEQIKRIANVKHIILIDKYKVVQRSITDSVNISEQGPVWTKETEPIGLITRAKDSKNYYDAISLSCSYFQSFGKKILLRHSQKNRNPISKSKMDDMDLYHIINELSDRDIIDKTTRDKMHEVRELRNDFQHDNLAFKISSSKAAEVEAKVIKALDCVKIIKEKYESLSE